ncbi:hypothetical protein [Aliikangiella coralliicola]|uniref:Uncharacterized protein n=1 Tax=Aliikangiella coralliicola TaxID=2592383 RepID=A0A545UAE7_9GAMM|nr:hypothetical protein [Aliikangiella coralliicola]TQV86444.1 hypothetical protein FLL46_16120 [Aliikangiella coralliicola]
MMTSLNLFLPDFATYQIEDLGIIEEEQQTISMQPLAQDWQAYFCQTVGYQKNDLPWTQLLLAQFNIERAVQTACCCEPVMVQLTHRGAYMIGQSQLQLSANDAIRIVSRINEQLMEEGERLYLVGKNHWLYTTDRMLELISEPVKDLIGKDLFNYAYGGKDAQYWQRLNNEIQMLIKQMVDYKELPEASPETMMNIHFHDPVNLADMQEIPFINNKDVTVVTDNEVIESFCMNTFLTHKTTGELADLAAENNVIIAFDSERESYPALLKYWLDSLAVKSLESARIICQDSIFSFNKRKNWLSRLLRL